MKTLARFALSIGAVAALLAGCGGSQPPIGAPGNASQSRAIANSAPAYKPSGPLLFVVNFDSPPYDAVAIYDPRANNPNPLAVINVGLSSPNGDCVDENGTLYVGSDPGSGSGWISEYALGHTVPSTTIKEGIDGPALCAIDRRGDLWVANNGGPANVTEYLKGSSEPHKIIKNGLIYPISVAFDHAGNMYVANHVLYGTTNVQVYPPGSKSPSRTITDGVKWPTGIAVDANGTLYVANDIFCDVEEYRAGQSHPYKAITNEINGPGGLSFGKNGWLYVSDEGTQGCSGPWPAVLEFRPGSVKPSEKMISKDLHTPVGIAYFPPLLP